MSHPPGLTMLRHNNDQVDFNAVSHTLDALAHQQAGQPLVDSARVPELAIEAPSGASVPSTSRPDVAGRDEAVTALGWKAKFKHMMRSGAGWKGRFRQIPVLGSGLYWLFVIMRMPRIRDQQTLDMLALRVTQAEDEKRIFALEDSASLNQRLLQAHLTFHGDRIREAQARIDALEVSRAQMLQQQMQQQATIDDLALRLTQMQQQLHRLHRAQAVSPAATPAETSASSAEPQKGQQHASQAIAPVALAGFDDEAFYAAFEDYFRGPRESVIERLQIYLPYVDGLKDRQDALVIDVGCGRGEWLEVLQGLRVKARGIDLNSAMVERCVAAGFDAVCADAMQYLAALDENSVDMVSGFHLIEHLSLEGLIALLDASLRVLKPGGMIMFETPNPENMQVGSCNFYFDPTHRNPLIPAVAEFIARQRGFLRAETLKLNPYPDQYLIKENSEAARRINQAWYGPQDFAVLAWKAHER